MRVGITHGDVNGVGYEIIFKAFADTQMLGLFNPIVYGSAKSASYHKKVLNNNFNFNIISSADEAREGKVNLVNCVKGETKIELGVASNDSGKSSFIALETACDDLLNHKIDILVTLPINKDTIQSEDFNFPGHTEYLQDKFGAKGDKALMIMATENVKVALVTTHMPLKDVSAALTKELIVEKLRTLDKTLKRDFRIDNPRIAVLGLNPHSGENGLLGNEEISTIAPAIEAAQKEWILCAGPFAADGFWGSGEYKGYDAVLAMYHDQGLIPFKTLAMEQGVNFTAGLPIVRTSPDHGTAYDIAGKNMASEESFRQAIYMAIDVLRNRASYDEAGKNPLKKMFYDRGKDDEKLDLNQED